MTVTEKNENKHNEYTHQLVLIVQEAPGQALELEMKRMVLIKKNIKICIIYDIPT